MPYLTRIPNDTLLLRVHVQPRGSQNEIIGIMGEALKIKLCAPPADGKANKALLSFLASFFALPKNALILKSGQQSRMKSVMLKNIAEEKVRELLAPYCKRSKMEQSDSIF